MEPVARRTRGGLEASMWAKHREWKEREKKEREKKEKEQQKIVAVEVEDMSSDDEARLLDKHCEWKEREQEKKEKEQKGKEKAEIVAIEGEDMARDDVGRDNLEIVGEGSFSGPSKKIHNGNSSSQSERNKSEENGFKVEEDVLIAESPKSSGSKRVRSDENQKPGVRRGVIDWSSFSGPSKMCNNGIFSSQSKRNRSEENRFKVEEDILIDESPKSSGSKRGRSDENQNSGKSKSVARKKLISSSESDSAQVVSRKGTRYEVSDDDWMGSGHKESFESSVSDLSSTEEDLDDIDYSAESFSSDSDSGSVSSEKKRPKRVHSRSDSQPNTQVPYSSSEAKELNGGSGGSGSDQVLKKSEKMWNKKAEEKKLSKKKTVVANIKNAINLLLAKTLSEEDGVSGDLGAPSSLKVEMQTGLPLKFRFEDEVPAPPEKEPWEIETDNLFAEMHMCLTAIYSGDDNVPSSASKVAEETEETLSTKSPMQCCRLGYHIEVLEEPLGIICKCCQLVLTEMKHIFPDLMTPHSKRRDSFYFGKDDFLDYNHNYIPSSDSVGESYISSIQTEGSVLELIPPITRTSMYQHQLDGFVFLWKNVVGETSIEKLKEMPSVQGSGCIISHAPGTGKTCLSIVFIMTLMRTFPYPECRPVIVAPKSMLLTWQHEFEKWDFGYPFHNLNNDDLSGKEIVVAGLDKMVSRENGRKLGKKYVRKLKLCSWMKQRSILGVSYNLFEKMFNGPEKDFLLEKPGLVVLDEGHTPRNKKSCMWKALKEVKTRKRIILSGTPFQNSFKELQTTLHLMNPDFSSKSDVNWKNLKSGKENEDNIVKLKAMIKPLVHVHTGNILEERLPGLKDMLVILRPTIQQKRAFEAISDAPNQFEKVHLVSLASVHPSLARTKEFLKLKPELELLDDTDTNAGVKSKFVVQLARLCAALGEKLLIFSEFIDPLKFLKEKFREELSWMEGKQILYMDGAQEAKTRQSSISTLNDPNSEVKVLLASTKACSEGIHLVGASRVVLLDVVWNPSVERQAISRAFRLGQKRMVYVYHLILMGTLEVHKYEMQTRKHRLAELVFSSRDMESKRENTSAAVAEDIVLEQMMDDKTFKGIFEEIVHNPKP